MVFLVNFIVVYLEFLNEACKLSVRVVGFELFVNCHGSGALILIKNKALILLKPNFRVSCLQFDLWGAQRWLFILNLLVSTLWTLCLVWCVRYELFLGEGDSTSWWKGWLSSVLDYKVATSGTDMFSAWVSNSRFRSSLFWNHIISIHNFIFGFPLL